MSDETTLALARTVEDLLNIVRELAESNANLKMAVESLADGFSKNIEVDLGQSIDRIKNHAVEYAVVDAILEAVIESGAVSREVVAARIEKKLDAMQGFLQDHPALRATEMLKRLRDPRFPDEPLPRPSWPPTLVVDNSEPS
ncbi:hypothetical protein IB238_03010 [Rhizobium sp. ARZ01]|uniref:hypothetical protein n=1 Tax=Rhizobium sp. ARZ01 TaxID=2769313 RepID=UPI00177BDC12|nr:hypothetical protein [Rhizobium sp. ARZ01]MBD9371611.1 hypothetical protein [Rhizobium sp. ARZ01]